MVGGMVRIQQRNRLGKENNGHVIGEKIYRDEDDQYISVRFPATITVEHQEGQQTLNYLVPIYIFKPEQSLYIKQGNTYLNGDIIVFGLGRTGSVR